MDDDEDNEKCKCVTRTRHKITRTTYWNWLKQIRPVISPDRSITICDGTPIRKSNAGSYEYCSSYQFMRYTHGSACCFSTRRAFTFTFSPFAIATKPSWYTISCRCATNIWAAKETSCPKFVESQSNRIACTAHAVWQVKVETTRTRMTRAASLNRYACKLNDFRFQF